MDINLRKSVAARVSAIGFILVIIAGNFWLVAVLLGQRVNQWIASGFMLGVVVAMAGGVGLLGHYVYRLLWPVPQGEIDAEVEVEVHERTEGEP